jgi:hypothetical protein
MAVPAIDAQALYMMLVAERDGLMLVLVDFRHVRGVLKRIQHTQTDARQ